MAKIRFTVCQEAKVTSKMEREECFLIKKYVAKAAGAELS